MRRNRDPEIIFSSAQISAPDLEFSRRAGRQAGEEDRRANILSEGTEVDVEQVRRIQEQYRSEHDIIGGRVTALYNDHITQAQGAHEVAGHHLGQANAALEETGRKLSSALQKREATAERVKKLVDPDLAGQPAERGTTSGPEANDGPLAFRYVLDRKLPKDVGYATLSAGAGAESYLNAQTFAATGQSGNGSLALAVLIGVALIGLAHLIGNSTADLLENRPGARGRSRATLAQVALGVPVLIGGIVATATVRATYYAEQAQAHSAAAVHIPTAALVALGIMLAAAAIAASIGMRNPFADDLVRQDLAIADLQFDHQQAKWAVLQAQNTVSITAAALHDGLRKAESDYQAQAAHVRKCAEAYVDGYCAAAGIRVTGRFPDPAPPQLIADARIWLAAHPFGSLAQIMYLSAQNAAFGWIPGSSAALTVPKPAPAQNS
jgi:hypothetical protein